MNCGFLYYAHNNEQVNYLKLAIISALTGHYFVKNFKATLITDSHSLATLDGYDRKFLDFCFEKIKLDEKKFLRKANYRRILDGFEDKGLHFWRNGTRPNAYEDSDYDQTILVDVDFIFQDSNVEKLWQSTTPIKLNKEMIPLCNENDSHQFISIKDKMVSSFNIPLYWATLMYFDRSDFSKDFFNFVNHIKDNYESYCRIYNISDGMYRNDYSFSIALYLTNGQCKLGSEFELPFKYVLTQHDAKIHQVYTGTTRFLFHTRNWQNPWQYINLKNISYHCMNKVSLLQNYGSFIEFYGKNI